MTDPDPLASFLAKYLPEIEAKVWPILEAMRRRLPGALELVYDNYQFLVIGYGPSERASEAIVSIAVAPTRVNLVFLQDGPGLDDPDGLLTGSGTVARSLRLEDAATLDRPAVEALIAQALVRAKILLDPANPYRRVIKSVSKKQRPRRPRLLVAPSDG